MGKIRRGGYLFITWKRDHSPKHLHIYKDDRLACKWNLEDSALMEGKITARLKRLIQELVNEGYFED
jgi:uncharacterized protein DUF4160